MALKSMKLFKDAKKRERKSMQCSPSDGPEFPRGLSISLDNESLKTLGIDTKSLSTGEVLVISAKTKITDISEHSREGGKDHKNVSLQITHMELASAKDAETESFKEHSQQA